MIEIVKEELKKPLKEALKGAIAEACRTSSAVKISTWSERRVLYRVAKSENVKVRIQKQDYGWLAFISN